MDFFQTIRALGERVAKLKDAIKTEEATKTALILPFLQALGYDVFNPAEVNPEFIADVGLKKGEKVDYAIMRGNDPIIIIECKHQQDKLTLENASQLLRYFHVTKTRIGVLTNGIVYKFYSDLVEPNKMDQEPFLEFDITQINDFVQVEELEKFHKANFDENKVVLAASEMKYSSGIKKYFLQQLDKPSEEFVKYFASEVYAGRMTAKNMEMFSGLVRKSLLQAIKEMFSNSIRSAFEPKPVEAAGADQPATAHENKESKIETTAEEIEAFFIIKSILRAKVATNRIFSRDAQSYFSILLDDNNRKPVCRLYLDGGKKYIGLFDAAKKEVRHEIKSLDDIYHHADHLLETVTQYAAITA